MALWDLCPGSIAGSRCFCLFVLFSVTLPETNIAAKKLMVGRLLSFWEGLFSGAFAVSFREGILWPELGRVVVVGSFVAFILSMVGDEKSCHKCVMARSFFHSVNSRQPYSNIFSAPMKKPNVMSRLCHDCEVYPSFQSSNRKYKLWLMFIALPISDKTLVLVGLSALPSSSHQQEFYIFGRGSL